MGSKITDVINEMIFLADSDLEARLDAQAEALRETGCINPRMGRWIDETEVNYLFAALALSDRDFAEEFPSAAHIKEQERRRFSAALEDHLDQCPHCSLKRGYDMELDARIEQVFQQNGPTLLMVLEEEGIETDSPDEGKPEGRKSKCALSATQ